jgi:hypothetical protein
MVELKTPSRTALFISHATPEDNHFVRWLGAKLTAMGYEVWADVMRLHGGIDWARELESALRKRAIKMLLVCTPNGLDKQGVRNEIEIGVALSRQLNDEAFIIPLRLEAYDPPFRIAQAQYIDYKRSWAAGLAELVELLRAQEVPRGAPGAMQTWLETQAEGADLLQGKPEPLVSNWLQIGQVPERIHYVESLVGTSLERFQNRSVHPWPVVPHRAGVIAFARPDDAGEMAPTVPGKLVASKSTLDFLEEGWPEIGIDQFHARRLYADLGSQAFDLYCRGRGLKGSIGSGRRISWWGDIKSTPKSQVKFDWSYRRGSRPIIGQSGKRAVYWHYAVNAQLRTAPLPHIRLSPRLVFSENGLDPIEDAKRSHSLRRSFAKGWRNARWRDMLCAYVWWMSDGKGELLLSVGEGVHIAVCVPPMQFSCPVSILESEDDGQDDDDPDVPDEVWSEEPFEEVDE